ncbi:putative RNA-directed DNA polymerase from transposon X-element [Trichonephila inaurata madagascariensis]|uniref:Putative RNA-directed DNA polymerase from transposon X-element n=1 Tax=Trichonephila inaurata madagascariensis TaxID=2747483 RepID=A0A8X6X702_9ARAC|nr:putative RNA-directed DNA polymerase from transposon X-element [Trichonephila inaurata madagascariensis]
MFLVENRNLDVPDIDYRDTVNLHKRVRYRRKLLNDLRRRFRKEYLSLLIQNKNKKGPLSELRLGEIVLIGDDIKKRIHWPLAKSTETPDDPLNDCTFANPNSSISSDMLSDPNDSSSALPRVSRYGRVIKAPEKLDLFNQALYVFESK